MEKKMHITLRGRFFKQNDLGVSETLTFDSLATRIPTRRESLRMSLKSGAVWDQQLTKNSTSPDKSPHTPSALAGKVCCRQAKANRIHEQKARRSFYRTEHLGEWA